MSTVKLNLPSYQPGDTLRQEFEIQKILGVGGFGIVYLVSSRSTKSVFALKTFRDDFLKDAETRKLFKNEAQIWINLERHPFLVRAHFVEEIEGRLFVGMEYIAPNEYGVNNLQDFLEQRSVSLELGLRWGLQFCYGMEHAYSKGVRCHRDIKPANTMIDANLNIKISDFGLASTLKMPELSDLTMRDGIKSSSVDQTSRGVIFGTPTHMPPEQFYDSAQCDERSDIYSFGIMLFQIQNKGQLPFLAPIPKDGTLAEQMRFWGAMHQLHSQKKVPDSKSPLNEVTKKCLEKDKVKRYQSFRDLRADIEDISFRSLGKRFSPPKINELEAWEWNNKGVSLLNLKRNEEALKCFESALKSFPDFSEAWNNKALASDALGMHDQAVAAIDKAIEIAPSNGSFWHNKGIILEGQGQLLDVVSCYEKAISFGRDYFGVWADKGKILITLGHLDKAMACFDKALELNPKAANVWYQKGCCFQKLNDINNAFRCADKALEINPHASDALFLKALCLKFMNKREDAEKIINAVIDLNPTEILAWQLRGNILEEKGRFGEAIVAYKHFLEHSDEKYPAIRQELVERIRSLETRRSKLSIENAAGEVRKAELSSMGKAPHIKALSNLATAYQSEGRWGEAIATHKKAISITEEKYGEFFVQLAPLLNNLAHLFFTLKRYDESKSLWLRAIRIVEKSYGIDNQNLGPILTNLAALYNQLDDYRVAQELCERALKIKEEAFGLKSSQLITTLETYREALSKQGLEDRVRNVELRIKGIKLRS